MTEIDNPKPDPFDKYKKGRSSNLGLKIIFWAIAPMIWLIFGGLSSKILVIVSILIATQIGGSNMLLAQSVLYIILTISYGSSLIFVIWLWRMYKRHMIENKPG